MLTFKYQQQIRNILNIKSRLNNLYYNSYDFVKAIEIGYYENII